MKEELINALSDKIEGENIILNNYLKVEISIFLDLFKGAEEVSYSELTRIDSEHGYGYSTFFNEWKKQGILN